MNKVIFSNQQRINHFPSMWSGARTSSIWPSVRETTRTAERQAMIELIEEKLQLLRRLTPTDQGSHPVRGVAHALDRCLYRTAPNFETYADQITLDDRLKQLIVKWMEQRRKIESKESTKAFASQTKKQENGKRSLRSFAPASGSASNGLVVHVAENDLWGGRRAEVMELVKEIQTLKLKHVGCAKCGVVDPCNTALPPQQPLPSPIRNLFFKTRLVSVVEQFGMSNTASSAATGNVDDQSQQFCMPMESLIQQARRYVQDYKEWSEHHSTNSPPMNRVSSMESFKSYC